MMADSGTYDQATILRRQKIAEQMLAESSKPQPIRHWAQGLAQLGNVGADAFALNRLDKQANESRKSDTAALMAGLNLGGDTATPSAPATPPMSSAAPSPMPAAVAPDPTQPRGIRNNNPLNIEAGDFTKGQPGFSGSDGRFAKFATPEQGTDAASKLLDVYSNKHGLNTVAGIVNRWAPATDGNPSQAYAASVAGRMGVAPDAPLNMADPTVKQKIIAAMGQFENGKPIPGNMVAGPGAPSGMPPVAPQVGAGAPPPAGPPSAPVGALAAPAPSPAAASPSGPQAPGAIPAPSGVAPSQKEAIARLLSSTPGSPAYQLGIQLAEQAVKPHDFTYQTLPDGTVLRMDPTGRTQPTPVYQAPTKPELKDSGTDPITGRKSYTPYNPITGQPIPPPRDGSASLQSGMLAKGVNEIDHSLVGPAYLQQFNPEVQAAVKTWMESGTQPTGSPRNNAMAGIIRSIGPKVAQDMGVPMSDLEARWTAHRKMQSDLASSGNSSMGGILANGNSAFKHLAGTSDDMANLGSYNGPNIIGGGTIGAVGNYIGNAMLPTPETKGKTAAVRDSALRYGQESTKFYAATGGGEAERMQALREQASPSATASEQAAFLETEKRQMLDRMHDKVAQVRNVMGDDYIVKHPEYSIENNKDLQSNVARIDANIARLRGGKPAEKPAEAPAGGGKVRTYNPETGKIE